MKLFPLKWRKDLSRRMNWFDEVSAILLIVGSLFAGFGGILFWQHKGTGGAAEKQEKIVLQQKVTHLLDTYKLSQAMDAVVGAADKGTDMGLVSASAHDKQKRLVAAFNAEAQATGIALATARKLSPEERYHLYRQLDGIAPHPDYLKATRDDDDNFLLFNHSQSKVTTRPGFTPTAAAARQIVAYNGHPDAILLGFILGSPLLMTGACFAFGAARRRLYASIDKEEKSNRRKEQEALQERAAKEKADAEIAAAEAHRKAAELERLSKLPPTLDRDITVKQIKLAPKA